MASFSFGSAPAFGAPGSAFGASSAPAFGAASTPAFGASPAPAFGASSAGAFGAAASAPAFGMFGSSASPSPSMFGAASTPAPSPFGFAAASSSAFSFSSSSPSMFGGATATSAPAFGAAASAPSMFGSPAPSLFGPSTGGMFGASTAAATAPGVFAAQQQQQQPGLITYSTRYDDLPADRQKELQDIQREISSYRGDCEKLDRDQRLHGSGSVKKSLEEETTSLKQSLQGMLNSIRADDEALADFREKVLGLLRSTESAVRTFQRAKLWRDAPQQYKGQIIPPQVQELLASPVVLPSPYLEQAIQGFQQTLENYRQVIAELEQALSSQSTAAMGVGDEASWVQQLPLVISHMHDFFVHVAAKLERLHQQVQRSKDAFIAERRSQGNYSDPFEESKAHMAAMSPKPDGRGSLHGHSPSPHHHHHPYSTALVPSTPIAGMTPLQGTPGPTPFGTPFGGPISPAAGDRSTASRRRR